MNQLNDISLITLSAFATVGVVCSVALICVFIYQWRGKYMAERYKGLVRDITGTRERMIKLLNQKGEQTAEFRWVVDILSQVARNREYKGDDALEIQLKEWREFFTEPSQSYKKP